MPEPTRNTCPTCPKRKLHGHYLCGTCWKTLPAAARNELNRRDAAAFRRLSDLHEQIRAGVSLNQIEITDAQ